MVGGIGCIGGVGGDFSVVQSDSCSCFVIIVLLIDISPNIFYIPGRVGF